ARKTMDRCRHYIVELPDGAHPFHRRRIDQSRKALQLGQRLGLQPLQEEPPVHGGKPLLDLSRTPGQVEGDRHRDRRLHFGRDRGPASVPEPRARAERTDTPTPANAAAGPAAPAAASHVNRAFPPSDAPSTLVGRPEASAAIRRITASRPSEAPEWYDRGTRVT